MRIPLAWLREYVELPADATTIIDRLAALGFPVETVEQPPVITHVVVGRIAGLSRHPNADRLQLCDIDVGAPEHLVIATAATNVAEGQIIPVALIGAQLPEMRIEPRKMRGIDSQGMLCSAAELGLPAEWFEDGILQLDRDLPLGADVSALFGLAEPILDVEVTANRPDAQSLVGLARELAAAFATDLRLPPAECPGDAALRAPAIELASPDVSRFVLRRVDGVAVGPAPMKMQIRLARAGQRPINHIVDISNYVMLEFGQPLHFYDAAHVASERLIVRDAAPGERLLTLDGEERTLTPDVLVVAGEQAPLGIAGIRGGASSEVTSATTSILIEAAHFRGARIRRSGIKLGLRTDASARFEKNLPPALTDIANARAAHLLASAGAHVGAATSAGNAAVTQPAIHLARGAAERLLGFALRDDEIEAALRCLGFLVEADAAGWTVTPPAWRGDIHLSADLIEEIARIAGYDRIEIATAAVTGSTISSEAYLRGEAFADRCAALGFDEAVSLSLEPATVRERFAAAGCEPQLASLAIINPLSEDQRFLRFSLLPGMLALLDRRKADLRDGGLRLFETGHVFGDDTVERHDAVFLLALPHGTEAARDEWRDPRFSVFKGIAEAILRPFADGTITAAVRHMPSLHPGKTAALSDANGRELAVIGAVDPRLLAGYDIDADVYAGFVDLDRLRMRATVHYKAPSRFPSISRDLALIVPDDLAATALEEIVRAGDELARDVRIFDEFRGERIGAGRKSLAVRVVLQRADATLTDQEADAAIERILLATETHAGAVLRR